MTTKPKTGKPAAKPATPGEFASLPYDGMTASIPKLTARLRFLEADCVYNAAIAPPDFPKHIALDIRHREERNEIMQRLAKTVPDCFDDAMTLLEFATARGQSSKFLDYASAPITAMLKNAAKGFYKADIQIKADYALHRFDERREIVEIDA